MSEQHNVTLRITRLSENASIPTYAHTGDAGLDLCAREGVALQPFERTLIPTGIALAIPEGYAGYVLPRSGLAIRNGLSLVNAPGLIDSGYRGEVKVVAINLDPNTPIEIKKGDRIAQLVIAPYAHAHVEVVETIDETQRDQGGFGSSGV